MRKPFWICLIVVVSLVAVVNEIDQIKAAHFEMPKPGTFRLTNGHGEDWGSIDLAKQVEAANKYADEQNETLVVREAIVVPGVYVYPLTREQQVNLMAECVEDAITVCQDANIYPLSSWYKTDALDSEMLKGDKSVILAAEIAVAFFNYRVGEE